MWILNLSAPGQKTVGQICSNLNRFGFTIKSNPHTVNVMKRGQDVINVPKQRYNIQPSS